MAYARKPGEARYIAGTGSLAAATLLLGHDLKRGLRAWLISHPDEPVPAIFDTALAHSLVYPDLRHTLDFVAESMLGYTPMTTAAATGQQDFLATLESQERG